MTTLPNIIGQFHPIFLHFPIVLFTAALVMDLLNYFGKNRTFIIGHWLVIAGVIMCIPTILTGLAAATSFDPNNLVLQKHRVLGYSTGIASSFYAGLRISAMCWKLPLSPSHYMGLSTLLVALVSWASDYGGLLTRGETPFNTVPKQGLQSHLSLSLNSPLTHSIKELELQLERQISVNDVIPIFAEYQCAHCHAKHFSHGRPHNFFNAASVHSFLEYNQDGVLKDFTQSKFYQVVILQNRMPIDHEGHVLGLSPSERLILLAWLKNGAPMN